MNAMKFSPQVWASVNWNLPASEIAAQLNCRPALVYEWATRLGKTLPRVQRGNKSRVEWHKVDWTKTTADLSAELGLSPQWISKMRSRYGR